MASRNRYSGFFLKRWVFGIGNALDQWLFGAGYRGERVGITNWWAFLMGLIAGAVSGVKYLVTGNQGAEGFSLSIAGIVTTVVAIVYLSKNLRHYPSLGQKLLRIFFVAVICNLGFGAGFLLGSVVVMFVVAVLILVVFVRVLFAMLGSSGSASRPGGGNSQKKHYYLDDGTEVEEVGNNIYEDVAGYTRYRKGVFTDEFEKIDW